VRVTTASGAGRRVRVFNVVDGYGKPTVAFHVDNVAHVGAYRVTVRRIMLPGRDHPVRHSYVVRLFDPTR
jgi:hypothetical protein